MRWRSAWAELRHGQLTKEIANLQRRCDRHEREWLAQRERADAAARLLDVAERGRKEASDKLTSSIVEDMQRNPRKYIP